MWNWIRWIIIFVLLLGAGQAKEPEVQAYSQISTLLPQLPAGFFVHTATTANTVGAVTYMDCASLNGSNHYYVFASQNWNPPGSTGVYNDSPIGLWYSADGPADPALKNRWAIVNQDGSNIPLGASFNVMYIGEVASPEVFLHYTSIEDVGRTYTILDHPAVNDDPNARLVIAYYMGMGGNPPTNTLNHNLAVYYIPTSPSTGRWAIINEDGNSADPGYWDGNAGGGAGCLRVRQQLVHVVDPEQYHRELFLVLSFCQR
jgi:hypothetical protein